MEEHDAIVVLADLCMGVLYERQRRQAAAVPTQRAVDDILKEYSTVLKSYISTVNNHNLDKRDLSKVQKDLDTVNKAFMQPEHLLHIKITEQVRLLKLDNML